jgi:hypothetical protein
VQRPQLEVAEVVRRYGAELSQKSPELVTTAHRRVLYDIATCRTAARGGHVYVCNHCGLEKVAYNACRNRHCPKCGGKKRFDWSNARSADLLPVPYFHLVFTLPHELAPLALQNKRLVYGMMFEAVSDTLLTLGADERHLGAQMGFIAVLHTWGQTLEHHPHLHCVVPGGGLAGERWVHCKNNFLLPVRVMRALYRGKLMALLDDAYEGGALTLAGKLAPLEDVARWRKLTRSMRRQKWVVYAKPPFGGPEQVLKYLARYTHRVAIGNSRLVDIDGGHVSFRWKDYRDGKQKLMRLEAHEFLRRFLLHVLPKGFVRIRYYGILSNKCRKDALVLARSALAGAAPAVVDAVTGEYHCTQCRVGIFVVLRELKPVLAVDVGVFDTS